MDGGQRGDHDLWHCHDLLDALLERARSLRGEKRLRPDQVTALADLLAGQSIELSSTEVPLAERALLGGPEITVRCSAAELLGRMSQAFDEAKTVVGRIGRAWETLIPSLDAARRLLSATVTLAEEVGESSRPDLRQAARTLAALGASITTDPLSVAPEEIDALARSLEAINRDLEATAELARDLLARIAHAHGLLETLRAAVVECEAVHAELIEKISAADAPRAPVVGSELDVELAEIAALAQAGAWRDARIALEGWSTRTGAVLADAQRIANANRAPIQARNQFRGLLDAYQVKAKRLGVLEDPRLAAIFARAREELYNAPTDLALVGQLVRRYQDALAGASATPESRR